jgi:hypothetical protein
MKDYKLKLRNLKVEHRRALEGFFFCVSRFLQSLFVFSETPVKQDSGGKRSGSSE